MKEGSVEETSLTGEERTYLLKLARRSIERTLGVTGDPPPTLETPNLLEPRGAFVTLKIDHRLKGCIGTIEPHESLAVTIADMAKAAAVSDPRFPPITEDELLRISIEISVLFPLRRVHSVDDIAVGRHGLVIEKGRNRGLLLPQVAIDAGWDAQTFLEHTCEKAFLPHDAWQDQDTAIYVFTAVVFGEEKEPTR